MKYHPTSTADQNTCIIKVICIIYKKCTCNTQLIWPSSQYGDFNRYLYIVVYCGEDFISLQLLSCIVLLCDNKICLKYGRLIQFVCLITSWTIVDYQSSKLSFNNLYNLYIYLYLMNIFLWSTHRFISATYKTLCVLYKIKTVLPCLLK